MGDEGTPAAATLQGAASAAQPRQIGPTLCVAVVTVALAARLYLFVLKYSVNILWWDQWDFYEPLFRRAPLWDVFNTQHGPIREGIGLVFGKVVADLTHWNTTADALAIAGIMLVAALAAIRLKYRLFGRLEYWDVIIPVMFLNITQYAMFIGTPNPSHGAFPVLLLVLYCLAWSWDHLVARSLAVLALNLLLIYTGFGLFIAPVTIVLFFSQALAWRGRDRRNTMISIASLVCAAAPVATFLGGYVFAPAAECFVFPDPQPHRYLWFMSLMVARFVGRTGHGVGTTTIGATMLAGAVAILLWQWWGRRNSTQPQRRRREAIIILVAFSLLFAGGTAMGRICLGIDTAQASRYVPYMIPLFLGLYFYCLGCSYFRARAAALGILLALVAAGCVPLRKYDRLVAEAVSSDKRSWKNCYLKHESISYCDQKTSFQIYPLAEATRLEQKLNFLKENRLNLYHDAP